MESPDDDIIRAIDVLAASIARDGINVMEVCGTHTMAIFRHGLHRLLPEKVNLLSGPGCPVCVTPPGYVDTAINLAREGFVVVTFGDMFRVPGSASSLEETRAAGCDIKVVYSPVEALGIARRNPDKHVIFLAVGFETTAPVMAAMIRQAATEGVRNLMIMSGHKLIPPAMAALLEGNKAEIDGFLCPGHVSVMIGAGPYERIAHGYRRPCVITGFSARDILLGIYMLLSQIEHSRSDVEIEYVQCVNREGNPKAWAEVEAVFEGCDSYWRGLGDIPASGLRLKSAYRQFDAEYRTGMRVKPGREPAGCVCGEVLRGTVAPPECSMFGNRCRPESPVGPCMVSSEGTCAAYFKYGGKL